MPRTARASIAGICYHVLNRGNRHATVFHDARDYARFLDLLRRACHQRKVDALAYCLMPNHFHIVARPREDGALGEWMQLLLSSHVRRYHRRHGTDGHVWQGRFKAFPIQSDSHLITVLRYVERNAARASLVERAETWRWGSLFERFAATHRGILTEPPLTLPETWRDRVNQPEPRRILETVRISVNRGRPFGTEDWTRSTAQRLELCHTLRRYSPSKAYGS